MFLLAFKIGAVKAPGIPKIEIPPKYTGQFPENTLVPWETQLVHQTELVALLCTISMLDIFSEMDMFLLALKSGLSKAQESQKLK